MEIQYELIIIKLYNEILWTGTKLGQKDGVKIKFSKDLYENL